MASIFARFCYFQKGCSAIESLDIQTPKATCIVFEEYWFFMKKWVELFYPPQSPQKTLLPKTSFSHKKFSSFLKDNEFRFKIIWKLKQIPKVSPNTMECIFWKIKVFWKNWYLKTKYRHEIKMTIPWFNLRFSILKKPQIGMHTFSSLIWSRICSYSYIWKAFRRWWFCIMFVL